MNTHRTIKTASSLLPEDDRGSGVKLVQNIIRRIEDDPIYGLEPVLSGLGEAAAELTPYAEHISPLLQNLISHQDPKVRLVSAELLCRLGFQALPVARITLCQLLRPGPLYDGPLSVGETVRKRAALLLGMFQADAEPREVIPELIAALKDHLDGVRACAASALGRFGPAAREAGEALFDVVKEGSGEAKYAAEDALISIFNYVNNNNEDRRRFSTACAMHCTASFQELVKFLRERNLLRDPAPDNPLPPQDPKTVSGTGPEHPGAAVTAAPETAPYQELARSARERTHAFRQQLAAELAPALNAHIRTMPHEALEQKKELARWVNDQLRPLGLAVRCPNTGLPARLLGIAGSYRPEVPGGTFCFETYTDGKQRKTAYSDALPELTLTDATPPPEPEKVWQQAVGTKASRAGRRR